jgi:hypothetical protein
MENEKIKIFVSTYACEPGLGSNLVLVGIGYWRCRNILIYGY